MYSIVDRYAACPALCYKLRKLPVIPDAGVATEQEMYRAQAEVKEFIRRGELYLQCSFMNSRQYNTLLAQLEIVAGQYNRELRAYQERQRLVAEVD